MLDLLLQVLLIESQGDAVAAVLQSVQLPPGVLKQAPKVAVHPSKAADVARWLPQLLELGLPPYFTDPEGQTPLSHMLLPLGVAKLKPLLETNEQRVISDTNQRQWKQNLLHAAVALPVLDQSREAVCAVAAKAAEQGWVDVFTAKSSKQQVAAIMCKNGKVRQVILDAEAQAKKVVAQAAKAKQVAAAAAAAEAEAAAAEVQKQEPQKELQPAGSEAEQSVMEAKQTAKDATKTMNKQAPGTAAEQPPGGETTRQRKERVNQLLSMLPAAVQGATAAAALPQQDLQQQQRLSSAQKTARDVALVRSRISSLAPEQLPDKDVAMGAGVLPGGLKRAADEAADDSDRKAKRQISAADSPLGELEQEIEGDSGSEEEEEGREAVGVAGASAGAAAGPAGAANEAELEAVNEESLSGLPWEFIITREAYVEWARLQEHQRKMVILRLRRIGLGTWQSDGISKRLNTGQPGLELWRTKITKGGRIIWQIAVDYSTERKCWLDMIRLWAIHMTHDPYMRSLSSNRNSVLQTIIASHRRSQQVRKRLQLRQLNYNTAEAAGAGTPNVAVEGQRLPAQYQPLVSGDDDEDIAAGVLPEVGGGVDATAAQIARLRQAKTADEAPAAAAARAPADGGQDKEPEQQQIEDDEQLVTHLPPANGAEDVYTLLKMYTISAPLVRAVLRGQSEDEVDFPFRVSEAEMRIIEMVPRPPSSILLLGRSGTGKTTVLVFRLFAAWLAAYQHTSKHLQAVFVTASATLKEQVSRTFRKLQAATITDPADAAAVAAATAAEPTSLINLAPAAFPLFTTTRQWLMLLDASVTQPFFARGPDGRLAAGVGSGADEIGGVTDWDGIGLEVDLQGWTDDEDEDYSDEEASEEEEEEEEPKWEGYTDAGIDYDEQTQADYEPGSAAGRYDADGTLQKLGRRRKRHAAAAGADDGTGQQQQMVQGNGQHYPSREITYADFVSDAMWNKMTKGLKKDQKACMKAPLVYAELMSYIKGSAEALEAGGHLSLEQYLELGAKRAPNFSDQLRQLVYRCYEAYERAKSHHLVPGKGPGWDRADLAAALYRNLCAGQYRGVRLDGVYRDEVQDFTQAELLLDLRLCSDPNSMFYCGDTCQTIARGVGFRFEDVKTLMYHEGQRRAAEGMRDIDVGMPKIEVLTVNYRTHAGILDAASSITALLRACFPRLLDKLPRERAFFNGPRPLLLDGLSTEELSILLSSGDPSASQVEFGAHQVVLVRDMEARERLPAELKASNALIMTGLEFDDVFLVDFCADSPAGQEWRVLLELLQGYEDTVAEVAKFGAAVAAHKAKMKSNREPPTWQQLAARLTAEDLRAAVRKARTSAGSAVWDSGAGAAVAAAERDGLLSTLPAAALLTEVTDAGTAASEAGGWLRPLKFNPEQHSLLCEELKHLYVAITRAKNNLVVFDRDGQKRAPLYHYLRRLGLATHVTSVTRGMGSDEVAAAAAGERSTFRGSMSNSPVEWVKRARNLAEMKLFQLAAQCYGCAGDVMRAAAYGGMHLLHDLHTSAQQAADAAAPTSSTAPARGSKASAARAAATNLTRAKRQATLLSAADVLLTCAVHGGALAAAQQSDTGAVSKASLAAISATAERAGLPVPSSAVEGVVAPPVTPAEQLMWLRLAANAFRQAGWQLEVGRLLLAFGPDFEEGRYWSLAKKLLKDYAEQAERSEHKLANCAAVAAVFEYAARQEMGLGSTSSTDSSTPDGSAAVGAAVPAVSGLHGSFLAAGRLLREALDMYKKAGRWSECWRLLRDYTGLKPLLKTQEIDGITLTWIDACKQSGDRAEMLTAIKSLRDADTRQAALKRHNFWRELAAIVKDPTEAARLLAAHGDYQAAAERRLNDPTFLERATTSQIQQVHSWLLRIGTSEAARKAVELWENAQQQGRSGPEVAEGIATAQLTLARLLLRQVVGAQLPALAVQQQQSAVAPAPQAAKPMSNKQKKKAEKEKQKVLKEHAKAAETVAAAAAPSRGDEQNSATEASASPAAAQPRSYAAAAATPAGQAQDLQAVASSSTSTSAAEVVAAAAAAALCGSAPIPTACLAKLQQRLQEQPDHQAKVEGALRALSHAQAAFSNCHQPAGALETLSWSLAAQPGCAGTTAQPQEPPGAGATPDMLKGLDKAKQAVELLQVLASVTGEQGRRHPAGLPRLSADRTELCLSSLERFYGLKQLADKQKASQLKPLEFRDESVMFMEALAALDTNPGSLLIAPAADSGQSHIHVPYKVAVRAMAVHIYKHLSALLARCMRVAEELLQQRAWLLAQLKEFQTTAAAASSVAGSGSGGGVKEAAAKGAKGNSSSGSKGADAKGGSASKGADAKAPEGLDTHAAEKQLQQSAEVLLLALSGHSCLRDAMSVLRSSHQLRDLANNGAAMFAESLGTKLSSLLVALEFPALGPTLAAVEYIHVQGSAGAMPLVQACVKRPPVSKAAAWLDSCRQLALQKAADQISKVCPYDPGAALWWLRASCYRHDVLAWADAATVQRAIQQHVTTLKASWHKLAAGLLFDPDAYQVMLEVPQGGLSIDAELLLEARAAFTAGQPGRACAQLLLLLERSLAKEQLAAGLITQQPAAAAAGSDQAANADIFAAAAAAAADESATWSKVRPLPPDVSLQLLELTAAAALIGLGTVYGGAGGSYIFLPETARIQLGDPVLVPGGLSAARKMWSELGQGVMQRLMQFVRSSTNTAASTQARDVLFGVLRVCCGLASTNWRLAFLKNQDQQQQQQQQQAAVTGQGAAGKDAHVGRPTSAAAQLLRKAGALAGEPSTRQQQQQQEEQQQQAEVPESKAAAQTRALVPLMFAEHLAMLAAGNFSPQTLQQQLNSSSSSSTDFGAFTAAAMPVLAARCALLLGCVVLSLGALDSGTPGNGGSQAGGPLLQLLVPAVAAAQQMVVLALDLAKQQQHEQQQQLEAAAASEGKWVPKPVPHWLVSALMPLEQLLDKLQPPAVPGVGSAGVTTRSKAAAAVDRRVSVVKLCDALLGLAKPLGVHLIQVTTLGAAEREFHGFSGKAASQMPKGDKALATASINCNMPPTQAADVAALTAVLKLPSLEEVHLNRRLSPAERKALEDKARQEERCARAAQQFRLCWLRFCTPVGPAVQAYVVGLRQRIAERKALEQTARAAEAAAAAAAVVGGGPVAAEHLRLPEEAYAVWGVSPEQRESCNLIKQLYCSTEIGRHGTDALRSAYRVGKELATQEQAGVLSAVVCPVCKRTTINQQQRPPQELLPDQQQQQPGKEQQQQQQDAGSSTPGAAGLSATAAVFVPHALDGPRHAESLAAYNEYLAGVHTSMTPALLFGANVEHAICRYLHVATDPELQVMLQRAVLLGDNMVDAARRLFEDVSSMLESRDWQQVQGHVEHLDRFCQASQAAWQELQSFQRDLQYRQQQRQAAEDAWGPAPEQAAYQQYEANEQEGNQQGGYADYQQQQQQQQQQAAGFEQQQQQQQQNQIAAEEHAQQQQMPDGVCVAELEAQMLVGSASQPATQSGAATASTCAATSSPAAPVAPVAPSTPWGSGKSFAAVVGQRAQLPLRPVAPYRPTPVAPYRPTSAALSPLSAVQLETPLDAAGSDSGVAEPTAEPAASSPAVVVEENLPLIASPEVLMEYVKSMNAEKNKASVAQEDGEAGAEFADDDFTVVQSRSRKKRKDKGAAGKGKAAGGAGGGKGGGRPQQRGRR